MKNWKIDNEKLNTALVGILCILVVASMFAIAGCSKSSPPKNDKPPTGNGNGSGTPGSGGTDTNLGTPGDTDPGTPGDKDPEVPGDTDPGTPGDTDPDDPGDTDIDDPTPDPPLPPADELDPVKASASEGQVVASVNEFRTFNGRDALTWSPMLGAVAKVLSKEVATKSIASLDARATAIANTTTLELSSICAIAGVGQPTAREVARFLEKVGKSKTAMLDQAFKVIAVSQYKGGKFGNYWVVLFAH